MIYTEEEKFVSNELARLDLYWFSQWMFEQRKGFQWMKAPHHEIICKALQRDMPGSPDINGSQTYTGDREEMLYLTAIGKGSIDLLNTIRNSIEDTTIRPTISANSFLVVEAQPVMDAHQYLDSMPEDRATLDLRIRFIDTWTTASGKPGVIETAPMPPSNYKVN